MPYGQIWAPKIFKLILPTTSKTITATAISSSSGSPPAYTGRTCTINKEGVCTFVDAYETLPVYSATEQLRSEVAIGITASECGTKVYETMFYQFGLEPVVTDVPMFSALFGSILDVTGGTPVSLTVLTDPIVLHEGSGAFLLQDGGYIVARSSPRSVDATAKRLVVPPVMIGESTLFEREYQHRMVEVAGKAAVVGLQVVRNQYAGLVTQAWAKIRGQGFGDLNYVITPLSGKM